MSMAIDGTNGDPRYTTRGGVYVPAGGGTTKWFCFDDRILGLFAKYGTEALPGE